MYITKPTVTEGNYDTVLDTYGICVVCKFPHLSMYVATEIEVLVFLQFMYYIHIFSLFDSLLYSSLETLYPSQRLRSLILVILQFILQGILENLQYLAVENLDPLVDRREEIHLLEEMVERLKFRETAVVHENDARYLLLSHDGLVEAVNELLRQVLVDIDDTFQPLGLRLSGDNPFQVFVHKEDVPLLGEVEVEFLQHLLNVQYVELVQIDEGVADFLLAFDCQVKFQSSGSLSQLSQV